MQPISERPEPNEMIRFGAFTVDLRAGELRKGDIRIALPDQAFQLLRLLTERPGDVVIREEIRSRLWPGNAHMDYERAVNTAIGKVRAALCDTAEAPRFIETLPKRGYRFIAAVEEVPRPVRVAPDPLPKPATGEETQPGISFVEPSAGRQERSGTAMPRRVFFWLGAAALAVASAVLVYLWLGRPLPPPRVLKYTAITNDGTVKIGPILTDGVRLYFNQPQGIAEVSAAGGSPILLAKGFVAIAISPAGSELLATPITPGTGFDTPLWLLPLPGGSPINLGVEGHSAAWSPDGERIVYARGRSLFVARQDGSGSRKLITLERQAEQVLWSPDGATIRFNLQEPGGGATRFLQVAADGTELRPVIPHTTVLPGSRLGGWTGDGAYFVLSSPSARGVDIWAVRERRGAMHGRSPHLFQLTDGPIELMTPVLLKDGKKLFAFGRLERGQLMRFDAPSGRFEPYLQGVSADGVGFSRDGEWVAYTLYPDGALWRSRTDGRQSLQLTPNGIQAGMPQWAPDGRSIAFTAHPGDGHGRWKIYTASAEGGSLDELLPGDSDQANPSWSPDGKSLVFAGAPWLTGFAPGSTAVHRIELATRLVSTIPGSEGFWSPRWSPNGELIVAETIDSKELKVYELRLGKWRSVAKTEGQVGYTCWSRDSKYVYFNTVAFGSAGPSIYRVNVNLGKAAAMLVLKDVRPWGRLGEWFGLAPDGSLLIMRDASVEEIYALDLDLPSN